jgi:hypothetical protein
MQQVLHDMFPRQIFVKRTGAELLVESFCHAHKANEYLAAAGMPWWL